MPKLWAECNECEKGFGYWPSNKRGQFCSQTCFRANTSKDAVEKRAARTARTMRYRAKKREEYNAYMREYRKRESWKRWAKKNYAKTKDRKRTYVFKLRYGELGAVIEQLYRANKGKSNG